MKTEQGACNQNYSSTLHQCFALLILYLRFTWTHEAILNPQRPPFARTLSILRVHLATLFSCLLVQLSVISKGWTSTLSLKLKHPLLRTSTRIIVFHEKTSALKLHFYSPFSFYTFSVATRIFFVLGFTFLRDLWGLRNLLGSTFVHTFEFIFASAC